MLYKLNSLADDERFQKILDIQRTMLVVACSDNSPFRGPSIKEQDTDEIKQTLQATFELDANTAKYIAKTVFRTLLVQLATSVADCDASTQDQIILAFDTDTHFHEHIDDPEFRFAYSQLPVEMQTHVKDLMVMFYNDFSSSGFPKYLVGNEGFDRREFVRLFHESANPELGVCPACDGQRPDKLSDRYLDDADHFLPKSVYPFLSMHPLNLVPMCLECNERIKHDVDPIAVDGALKLTHCFHPYVETAAIDHIDVVYERNELGDDIIHIEDNDGMPSARVMSLNNVFSLENRWLGRMTDAKKTVHSHIQWFGRGSRRGDPVDKEEAREVLREMLNDTFRPEQGKQPNYIICSSYFQFVLNDDEDFCEVFDKYLS